MRRLPADTAGLRGRTAHDRRTRCRSRRSSKPPATIVGGPYDVSLVEGSITTAADERRIKEIREQSKILVTIGACATAGGVQALRNFADIDEFTSVVYAKPEYIDTLATSTPASAHVKVDYQLQGCPIDRGQLLDTLAALLVGRKPRLPAKTVCTECKTARGDVCRCGRGYPVPRPGDARRMRGVVPVVSPRLLRLFRSCRNAQHRRVYPGVAPRRDVERRCRPGVLDVQRRPLSRLSGTTDESRDPHAVRRRLDPRRG